MPHVEFTGPDGQVWPSATQLTSLLPQYWKWNWYRAEVKKHGWRGWQKCDAISRRAMRLGTHVHGIIEMELTGKPYTAHLDERVDRAEKCIKTAAGILAGIDRTQIIEVEKHVINQKARLHGTIDCVMRNTIDDWKTSKKMSDDYAIQLAVYAMGLGMEDATGRILRKALDSKTDSLQIKEFQNLKYYYPIVEALRVIWGYVNKKDGWER